MWVNGVRELGQIAILKATEDFVDSYMLRRGYCPPCFSAWNRLQNLTILIHDGLSSFSDSPSHPS